MEYDDELRHYESLEERMDRDSFNRSFLKNMFEVALRALEEDFPNYTTEQKVKDLYLDIVTLAEFILQENDPTIKDPIYKKSLFEMVNSIESHEVDPLYDPNEDILRRWAFSYMWTLSNALNRWTEYHRQKL